MFISIQETLTNKFNKFQIKSIFANNKNPLKFSLLITENRLKVNRTFIIKINRTTRMIDKMKIKIKETETF